MISFVKRHRAWLIAALVLVLGLTAFGVQRWRGQEVEVVEVQPQPLQQSVVASGRVLTPARVELGSVITGRVAKVLVEESAVVKAGDLLIQLEPGELGAALRQADAALERAKARLSGVKELNLVTAQETQAQAAATLRWSEQDLKRNRELKASGFIGQAKVDEAERAYLLAKSQFDAAKAQVGAQTERGTLARESYAQWREADAAREFAAAKLAQTEIRSPAAAMVLTRQVESGDIVQPAKVLLTLAVAGETRITAQIDEKNLALLQVGQSALASADAFPEQRFAADLYYLAPGVDAQRGAVEARLRVPQPPAHLRADMTVSIEILAARKDHALVVPSRAVRGLSTASPHVLVLLNDQAHLRPVQAGFQGGDRVEIVSGLKAGDRVILNADVSVGARLRGKSVTASHLAGVTK